MKGFSASFIFGALLFCTYTIILAVPTGENELSTVEGRDDYCTTDKLSGNVKGRALNGNDTAIIEKRSGSGVCFFPIRL